jgi:hypothetical protein
MPKVGMSKRDLAMELIVAVALTAAIMLIAVMLFGRHARSEPLPYPKPRGGQCGSSYTDTGGMCAPKSGGTVRDTIVKPRGTQCPPGWASSGSSCERMGR